MFFVKIAEGWIRSRVHCCLQQLLYHCATTAAFDLNSLSGPFPASFYFRLFNTVDSRQMINIKIWRWPDSNRRPLASEGTSLPTEPQATLCSIGPCFQFNGFYKKWLKFVCKVALWLGLSLSLFKTQSMEMWQHLTDWWSINAGGLVKCFIAF